MIYEPEDNDPKNISIDEIVAEQPMTAPVAGLETVWLTIESKATSILEECGGDWKKANEARKTILGGGEVAILKVVDDDGE